MAGLIARLLVIGVVVAGGLIFRDRLTGGAGALKAGDCFDDKQATEVKTVQHHPCTEAHTAEVVLVGDYPAAKGAPYPSGAQFDTWAESSCVSSIVGYVGAAANLDSLSYGFFYPKAADWTDGERQVICFVTRADFKPMTTSLRAGS